MIYRMAHLCLQMVARICSALRGQQTVQPHRSESSLTNHIRHIVHLTDYTWAGIVAF